MRWRKNASAVVAVDVRPSVVHFLRLETVATVAAGGPRALPIERLTHAGLKPANHDGDGIKLVIDEEVHVPGFDGHGDQSVSEFICTGDETRERRSLVSG